MNEGQRRIIRAWKRIEQHKAEVSWKHKSWTTRYGGIPKLVNFEADPEGKPEPSFETALEAVEAYAKKEQR